MNTEETQRPESKWLYPARHVGFLKEFGIFFCVHCGAFSRTGKRAVIHHATCTHEYPENLVN